MANDTVTGWDMAAFMGTKAVHRLALINHNLANTSTIGFKQELLYTWRLNAEPQETTINLPRERIPDLGFGFYPEPCYYLDVPTRDYTQGAVHNTGGQTDLALDGPGFFKVETPRGIRYTRNGSFRLDPEYSLVTREGYPVLGKNGPINLDATDKKFSIDPEGGIHLDKSLQDQILVVDFPNPQGLIVEGGNFYAASADSGPEREAQGYRIQQGALEESNVDPTVAMVQLLDNLRCFEAYLKILGSFQTSDQKVIREVGRL